MIIYFIMDVMINKYVNLLEFIEGINWVIVIL